MKICGNERSFSGSVKQATVPRRGSVVIIQDESKNRNVWKLGIVTDLINGKNGTATKSVPKGHISLIRAIWGSVSGTDGTDKKLTFNTIT